MAVVAIFILPEVKSESFSGLICKRLKTEEELLVKTNLLMFLNINQEAVTWFGEPVVNPIVRASTMKHLLPLFESLPYKDVAESRLDVAIRLIVENAKLPSEIHEGLSFLRKFAMKDFIPQQASGAEDAQIRIQIATALLQLLNKLSLFEICEAKIEKEKRDASRAMGS